MTATLRLDCDPDSGLTCRIIDLLTIQDRLPDQLVMDRHPSGTALRLIFPVDRAPSANLVTRLRLLPGVRSVT